MVLSTKYPTIQIPIHQNRRSVPFYRYTTCMHPLLADSDDNEAPLYDPPSSKSFLSRIKKIFSKKPKAEGEDGLSTRDRLAKLGFAVLLSYGFVSNMSAMIFLSLAWFSFSLKTGLSPLAPGQWKPFTLVYAGFYVISNLVRPVRVAIAIAIGKYFDSILKYLQDKFKLSRSASIAFLVFGANVVLTTLALISGVSLASLLSGVPVFPRKVVGV